MIKKFDISFNPLDQKEQYDQYTASIDDRWNDFFLDDYSKYVTSSISSSLKVFKSFLQTDITYETNYMLTKSLYDEYFYDVYGSNFIKTLYTSSIQNESFDILTRVYFNPDEYTFGFLTSSVDNKDEYRLLDIVYGNYAGSGSASGKILLYNDYTKNHDMSYPSKAMYYQLKQLSVIDESHVSDKIVISSSIDNVFGINISANHLYDGIAKKTFELTLCKMNGSASINSFSPMRSIQYLGTNGETEPDFIRDAFAERELYTFIELTSPTENVSNRVRFNYVVSGSLESGVFYQNGQPDIYGRIYYDQGLVVFNADKLNGLLNLNIQTGSNSVSNNSLRFFKSMQAALDYFWIITDGNLDPTNPFFPEIENTIVDTVSNVITTPKLKIKQEMNSVFYRCKLDPFEFNYSTNPTYFDESDGSLKIQQFYTGSSDFYVKPESYITSIGLYDSFYNLLAVAKISKPQRKSFTNSLIINIRLDY